MLFPHSIYGGPAFDAFAFFNQKLADLEAPAFDDRFATVVTKRVLPGIARDIAGINIFEPGV